jgi:hypothetical protein
MQSVLKYAAWCLIGPAYLTALFIADALHSVPAV